MLVPRPETETLVDVALELIDSVPSPVVCDVGTGSGAVALAIATRRPDAQVWGTDVSSGALAWAERNARTHANHVRLTHGDLFASMPPRLRGYHVGNSVQAKIRDLKNAGKTISASATAAGNAVRIDGISFDLQDNVALLKSARDAAMADAKTKADQYANDSGRKLGKVVVITEQQQPSYPAFAGAPAILGSTAGPSYVPIAAGVQQVTVTVTVVYEFA